jgi:hypothetical protein
MSLITLPQELGQGAAHENEVLGPALRELQGEDVVVVAGAAAGTKMNVAPLRSEDTLQAVISYLTAGGPPVDDTANCSISSTKAFGTVTISGNPVNAETVTVNGVVYTFVTAGTEDDVRDVTITPGNNPAMAAALAAAINAYENRRAGGGWNPPAVVATSLAGVVTVTSVADEVGNGPIVTSGGGTITISNTDPGAVTATSVSAVDTDTLVVNGVTFTVKTVPVDLDVDVPVEATDAEQATELARAINAYQNKFGTINAAASAATNVVTITASQPRTGNSIKLSELATNVAVTGSGYLTGGTATGGFTSTTNNAANTMHVTFYNKR